MASGRLRSIITITAVVGIVIAGPATASIGDEKAAVDQGIGTATCVQTVGGVSGAVGVKVEDCEGVSSVDPPIKPEVPTPTVPTPPTPPVPPTPTGPQPGTEQADVVIDLSGTRSVTGSSAIGSTSYAVPSNAVVVAPSGLDGNPGTMSAPVRNIQRAIDRAPSGSTIVVREGEYRESITLPREKRLTVQAYPGEKVWLDGSEQVTAWQKAGSSWYTSGWTTEFDTSPTYTRGAPDNKTASWSFLNPDHPLAAHPDQVWTNGAALRQVASTSALAPGTFYVDRGADRLYVGSDPASQSVRASKLVSAIRILGSDSVIRGIGVRRFAPSVPDMGAVAVYAKNVTFENMSITDNATTGLSINGTGAKISKVTVARNGMLGMHANYADDLVVSDLLSADNNTEHFNRAPVSGGLKITRSRVVSVTDSAFVRNDGNALWFDESVYSGRIAGNDLLSNSGNAVVIELSARFVVADNVIGDNGLNGVLIDGSGTVDVWNNTIVGNNRAVKVAQGDRRASNLSTAGHDPRQSNPDPTMTWITEKISIGNNILSTASGNCIIGVEDYSHERSAQQMSVTANGNVYHRSHASQPAWTIVWSRGVGDPAVYTTIVKFTSATGQEQSTLALEGEPAVYSGWVPSAPVLAAAAKIFRPLPQSVIDATGRATAGTVGAWAR